MRSRFFAASVHQPIAPMRRHLEGSSTEKPAGYHLRGSLSMRLCWDLLWKR